MHGSKQTILNFWPCKHPWLSAAAQENLNNKVSVKAEDVITPDHRAIWMQAQNEPWICEPHRLHICHFAVRTLMLLI